VLTMLGMVSRPLGAPAQTIGRIPPPVVVAPGVSEFTATLPAFRPPLRRSAASRAALAPSRIAASRQPRHPPRLPPAFSRTRQVVPRTWVGTSSRTPRSSAILQASFGRSARGWQSFACLLPHARPCAFFSPFYQTYPSSPSWTFSP